MKKVLIANRGEIALRIMKTAKRMGIRTVAIYSNIDRKAPHVIFADEAIHIGENPSNQSYLLGDKIIEKALENGVDAIHPGYGFLSENEHFAKAVEAHNMTFIGPGHKAIKMMGDKLAAKAAVKKFNIPMVPGIDKAVTNVKKAKEVANKIGYPVLIKAAAGGGGKGMRVVNSVDEIEAQMERAGTRRTCGRMPRRHWHISKLISTPIMSHISPMADHPAGDCQTSSRPAWFPDRRRGLEQPCWRTASFRRGRIR